LALSTPGKPATAFSICCGNCSADGQLWQQN